MNTRVNVLSSGIATPRGSSWIAQVADAVRSFGTAARASAAARRRVRDAMIVRDYALQIEHVDPGMAADLRAAVDRHIG